MANLLTAEKVIVLADRLPPLEKLRLVEWLLARLERELQTAQPRPSRLARGIWQGPGTSEEELAEVRRELWGGFPRDMKPCRRHRYA